MNEDQIEVTITTTEEPKTEEPKTEEPITEPTDLKILVGELKAKVDQILLELPSIKNQIESLQSEDRWTSETISNLAREVYQMATTIEENQSSNENVDSTENESESSEQNDQIPVVPDPVTTQEEPETTQAKKRPWWY